MMVIYKPHAAAHDSRYCSYPHLLAVNILWAGVGYNQINPSHFRVSDLAICVMGDLRDD